MRYLLILIIPLQFNLTGNAQKVSGFDCFIGYGFYEGINLGGEYFLKSGIHSISLSAGFTNSLEKEQKYFTLAVGYNIAILRNQLNKLNKFKWHVDTKIVGWQLEDTYYRWKAISIIPSINRSIALYKNIGMSVEVGPSYQL